MASLTPKGKAGDVAGQMKYRIARLQARITRIGFCSKRAAANKDDKSVDAFSDELEMREAELNFLSKKLAVREATA
jgi:hypothetical protein